VASAPASAERDGTRLTGLTLQGDQQWAGGVVYRSDTESDPLLVGRSGTGAFNLGGALDTTGNNRVHVLSGGPQGRVFGVVGPYNTTNGLALPGAEIIALNGQGQLIPECDGVPLDTDLGVPVFLGELDGGRLVYVARAANESFGVLVLNEDCEAEGEADIFQFRATTDGTGLLSLALAAFTDGDTVTILGQSRPIAETQKGAILSLDLGGADPEVVCASTYSAHVALTAGAIVEVTGQPERIVAAGPRASAGPAYGFYDAGTCAAVGSPAAFSDPFFQPTLGVRGPLDVGPILGGQTLDFSTPPFPQAAFGAAEIAPEPPPALKTTFGTSGWVAHRPAFTGDPNAVGSDLTVDGITRATASLSYAWTGRVDSDTHTAGVTTMPASGVTTSPTTTAINGATVPNVTLAAPDANDPPVNHLPPSPTIRHDETLTLPGTLFVTDPDAGPDDILQVELSTETLHRFGGGSSSYLATGTLTLSTTAGLTFVNGDGTDDTVMAFRGKLADINAALNGLRFTPFDLTNEPEFAGLAGIKITTDDEGHNGTGGAKQDTDTLSINVTRPAVQETPAGGGEQQPPIDHGSVSSDVCPFWDWEVTATPPPGVRPDASGIWPFSRAHFEQPIWMLSVKNVGPCPSPPTSVQVKADDLEGAAQGILQSPSPPFVGGRCGDLDGEELLETVECDVPRLLPGQHVRGPLVHPPNVENAAVDALVECNVAGEDSSCANNEARFRYRFGLPGPPGTAKATVDRVRDQRAADLDEVTGKTSGGGSSNRVIAAAAKRRGARKVQVALVRLPDERNAKCQWLTNARARFRSIDPVGTFCTHPVWLTAKGTKRWVYKFKKTLPKGSYLLYARALDSKNRPQVVFDKRNKVAFKLR
jgi:hypothetical protein